MHIFRTKAQTKLSKTEQAVADYLAEKNVAYAAVLLGKRKDDEWAHDEWETLFTRNRDSLSTEYSTGLGHRVARVPMPADLKKISPHSAYVQNWIKDNVLPHKPVAAGVLGSVILDSLACGVSFSDWCGDFGYDTDSLKARNTYDACQAIGDKFTRFFTEEERAHLAELLADY